MVVSKLQSSSKLSNLHSFVGKAETWHDKSMAGVVAKAETMNSFEVLDFIINFGHYI